MPANFADLVKNWRDRLIGLAARHPDWVVGYVDEVWWSRLAQPAMHAWGETLRLHARARAKDDLQPKALVCYGLLRTDQDRVLLRCVEGCQSASKRAPGSARNRDPSCVGYRRSALGPTELVGVARRDERGSLSAAVVTGVRRGS